MAITTAAPQRAGRREWFGLAVLALPTLLIAMDFTALHLAVPAISAALQPTSTELLWIVDSYGFAIAGLLIAMGTLGDRIGRRKLLLIGGTAFAGASLLAAFAPTAETLIAARALLGVTGATLLPSTLALITTMFTDPAQRRKAIAVWSANFLLGGVIGPLVGGVLLQWFWWGSVFLPAVPAAVILLVAGPLLLPEYRSEAAGRVDPLSVLLAMGGILPLVYGIKGLAASSVRPEEVLAIGVGLVLGWLFLRRQRRLESPLLDLSLFSRLGFTVPLAAQFSSLFVLSASQYFVMQYLQLVLGQSPLAAGLWSLPAMVAGLLGTLLVPRITRYVRPRRAAVTGIAIGAIGAGILIAVDATSPAMVVIGFAVINLGLNPAMTLTYDLILSQTPEERAGTASGIAETGNELGIAMGIALGGSLGTAIYQRVLGGQAVLDRLPGQLAEQSRQTLAAAIEGSDQLPPELAASLVAAAREAFVRSFQVTGFALAVLLVIIAGFVGIGLRRAQVDRESPPPRSESSDAQ